MGGNRGELAGRHAEARANARVNARVGAGKRRRRWAGLSLIIAVLVAIAIIRGGDHELAGSRNAEPAPGPGGNKLPSNGPGTFLYDSATGPVLGDGGPIKRFDLAVESNLPEDLGELSRLADATLADPRGWAFGKQQRFQRVPSGSTDFTIALVTRETAYRLCEQVGLDIRESGVPYTSCQADGWVVINLDRWRLSTPDYVGSGTPLLTYRQYVINHEVGHHLGYSHEQCVGQGELAPVMQQQTLGLDGCLANPWPHPNGVT